MLKAFLVRLESVLNLLWLLLIEREGLESSVKSLDRRVFEVAAVKVV